MLLVINILVKFSFDYNYQKLKVNVGQENILFINLQKRYD